MNYIANYYETIKKVDTLYTIDNDTDNIFISIEQYTIDRFWGYSDDSLEYKQTFTPSIINDKLARPSTIIRKMPFALSFPNNVSEKIIAYLPDGWSDSFSEEIYESNHSRYKYTHKFKNDTMTLTYSINALQDHVKPEQTNEFIKNVEDFNNSIAMTVSIPVSSKIIVSDAETFWVDFHIYYMILLVIMSSILFINLIKKDSFFIKRNDELKYLNISVALMFISNFSGFLRAESERDIILMSYFMIIGLVGLWFYWKKYNFARVLVILISILGLISLIDIDWNKELISALVIYDAMISIWLIYWLNLKNVKKHFLSKPVEFDEKNHSKLGIISLGLGVFAGFELLLITTLYGIYGKNVNSQDTLLGYVIVLSVFTIFISLIFALKAKNK